MNPPGQADLLARLVEMVENSLRVMRTDRISMPALDVDETRFEEIVRERARNIVQSIVGNHYVVRMPSIKEDGSVDRAEVLAAATEINRHVKEIVSLDKYAAPNALDLILESICRLNRSAGTWSNLTVPTMKIRR